MIKLVVMIKRKPGMPKEDFHRYWSGPHAEQVLGCADFKRHLRLNEPRFLAEVHPDDATFIDMEGCKLMVVEEITKVA